MCFIKLILFSGWSPRAALCCWQPNRAVASREGRLQGAGWGQLLHRAAWSWQGLFSVPPLASPLSWSLPCFLFLSSPPPFLLPLPFFHPLCFYLSWERRTYFFLSFFFLKEWDLWWAHVGLKDRHRLFDVMCSTGALLSSCSRGKDLYGHVSQLPGGWFFHVGYHCLGVRPLHYYEWKRYKLRRQESIWLSVRAQVGRSLWEGGPLDGHIHSWVMRSHIFPHSPDDWY